MAGSIIISTLKTDANVFAQQNAMTGIPKAWVAFNPSTSAILGSFNVSGISSSAAGTWTISFTTAMPSPPNYALVGICTNVAFAGTNGVVVIEQDSTIAPTTGAIAIKIHRDTVSWVNPTYASIAILSN